MLVERHTTMAKLIESGEYRRYDINGNIVDVYYVTGTTDTGPDAYKPGHWYWQPEDVDPEELPVDPTQFGPFDSEGEAVKAAERSLQAAMTEAAIEGQGE